MFSDAELSLIKNTFGDEGEDYLYFIRNVLLQFPLTKEEIKKLSTAMTPEVYAVVKKKILPEIDPEAPFGQLGDLYQTLHQDLQKRTIDEMSPLFLAKKLEVDYLSQQFAILKDLNSTQVYPKIVLDDLKEIKDSLAEGIDNYVRHTARNFILSYVDSFLIQLKIIAGNKAEKPERQRERLTRDSSK